MSDLYRDFIDQKADQIINSLGGTITPAPPNELYRDFLDRKFDDVINACNGLVKVKSFTYIGDDSTTNDIIFDNKPKFIFGIFNKFTSSTGQLSPIAWGVNTSATYQGISNTASTAITAYSVIIEFIDDYTLRIRATTSIRACNYNNATYTVYYI